MKFLTCVALITCAIGPVCGNVNSSFQRITEAKQPQNIQILIEKDVDGALLEVKGPYHLFNPHDGSKIASGLLGKRFMIHETNAGLKWGEEFAGIHQMQIKPRSSETSIFINGIQYSGAVTIYGIGNKIQIINDVDIDSYIKSTLTTQFPTPFEPEVMSALAILARTNAYYTASKASNHSFWQIAAKDVNYQGSALVVSNSVIDKSVDSTKNLILVHSDHPFATTWTEHSAGKTAPYSSIFRKDVDAPTKGVEAPHAALARNESKWSYQIGKKTLAHLLGVSQIKSCELFIDQSSSKVYGIRFKDGEASFDLDFVTLQQKLGDKHLLSSDFTVSMKDDAVVFNGFGKGHGVGLCLYSANALAQNGENAVKILSKFFPETYLYNMNAIPKE
jgi:stage II sporulation protein D